MLRWTLRSFIQPRSKSTRPSPNRFISSKSKNARASQPASGALPSNVVPPRTNFALNKLERIVGFSIALGLGMHVFFTYFFVFEAAYGISMLPTISSFGDWLLISKYYRRGRGIRVGDLVSYKHPAREGVFAVKRVIGMEGDFVLMNTPGKSDTMIQVPQGHCWLVGDDLTHSRDSRMFGPLPMALLSGKVLAKVQTVPYGQLPKFRWIEHGLQPAVIEDDDID